MSVSLFSLRTHRLRICFLLMLGLYVAISMRLNLSMGITCMVSSTSFDNLNNLTEENGMQTYSESCRQDSVETDVNRDNYGGSLQWSPQKRSLLFSATFYGTLVTMPFSGYFADRYGPKMIFLFAVLDFVLMTLAGPLLAETSYWAFFVSRVIMGLGEGFIFPCLNSMASKWFPPDEKSTVGALYTSGNQLAAAFTPMIVASLCTSSLGWPSIFYMLGFFGIVWTILWHIFASNLPIENKWISDNEIEFLERHIPTKKNSEAFQNGVPWREILFGKVVMANYTNQFAFNFSITIMQSFLPTFLKETLALPLHLNGLFTMVPFITQLLSKNILALISDSLKSKKILTADSAVRIFQAFGFQASVMINFFIISGSFGSAFSLLMLAILPSCENRWVALPILASYGIFFSAATCGYFTSIISIAPPYSGTMTSITRTYATAANLCVPLLISLIQAMNWSNKWLIVFLTAICLKIVTGIFFLFCGEAKIQPWVYAKSRTRAH